MLQHNPTTEQTRAVIARLLQAYADVALCEQWLQLKAGQQAADHASERMKAIAQEARA